MQSVSKALEDTKSILLGHHCCKDAGGLWVFAGSLAWDKCSCRITFNNKGYLSSNFLIYKDSLGNMVRFPLKILAKNLDLFDKLLLAGKDGDIEKINVLYQECVQLLVEEYSSYLQQKYEQ